MNIKNFPLFWKIYGFIVIVLIIVVSITELILESVAKYIFLRFYTQFSFWHEFFLWVLGISIPAFAGGYILSKILFKKLHTVNNASQQLAQGNLAIRLPVIGNDKDDFDVLSRNFNNMANAIQQQINNERRLLADISHELRSPLTRMTLAIELLNLNPSLKKDAPVLIRLEKEVSQMGNLVSSLLSQAKNRFQTLYINTPVNISTMLINLIADYNFQGKAQNKQFQNTIEENSIIQGHPVLLHRVFNNILSNALFYAPDNSFIDVKAYTISNSIILTIRDYGTGVPTEQLADLFRAFYRADNSRSRLNGGVGLGLTMAKEAVLYHNGTIQALNATPGLQITITLPINHNE